MVRDLYVVASGCEKTFFEGCGVLVGICVLLSLIFVLVNCS